MHLSLPIYVKRPIYPYLFSKIAQRARGGENSFPEPVQRTPPKTTTLKPKPVLAKKITLPRKPLYPARQTSATATPPRRGTVKKNSFKTGTQAVLLAKGGQGRTGIPRVVPVPIPVSVPAGKSDSDSGSERGSRNTTAKSKQVNRTGRTGSR